MFTYIKNFFKRIGAIKHMMQDKGAPKWKKAIIIFGLVYLVLPFEALPDILIPVGYGDDIVLWICIMVGLKDTLNAYIIDDKAKSLSEKYKNTIEDVDYEVKEK